MLTRTPQIYLYRDAFNYGRWDEKYRDVKHGHQITVSLASYSERSGDIICWSQCMDFPNASEGLQTLEFFAVAQQKSVQVHWQIVHIVSASHQYVVPQILSLLPGHEKFDVKGTWSSHLIACSALDE